MSRTTSAANEAVGEFDVFLAHNSKDKPAVIEMANELRRRGLLPWLDQEQVPPGRWFQDVIQSAVPKVKSAAIILGPSGLGKWEAVELRAFISECVERDLPVIPVLLPGASEVPILSLMEEQEAVDWYNQRAETACDPALRAILIHNANEEKEHAAMIMEWIRRRDKYFDHQLRDYLFTDKPIAHE